MRVLLWVLPDGVLALSILALVVTVIIWCGFLKPAADVFWFFARPFAILFGSATPVADDYIIRGWKAERHGQWAAALAEYDKALELNPRHPDARERRDALLEAHPELADRI